MKKVMKRAAPPSKKNTRFYLCILSGVAFLFISCGPVGLLLERDESDSSHENLNLLVPGPVQARGLEVVPADELDSFFPIEGDYSLEAEERELLRIAMYRRYDRGFYEPGAPRIIVAELERKLKEAEKEGVTYNEIQDEFIADARRGRDKMPDYVLANLRWVAGNSVVVTIETIRRADEFKTAGMDLELMERSLERMRELRRFVIDEQNRRKYANDGDK